MLSFIASRLAQFVIDHQQYVPYQRRLLKILAPFCSGLPLRSLYGVTLEANLRDVTNQLCLLGRYGDEIVDTIRSLAPGAAFIDIGANIGLFSTLAAKHVGRSGIVISFEPQLELACSLLKNAALNNLSNIFLVPAAITNTTDVFAMKTRESHTGSAHLAEAGNLGVFGVRLADMERLVASLIGRRPILVKIDVEGAELLVIRELEPILSHLAVSALVVEIDDTNLERFGNTRQDVYEFLGTLGFTPSKGKGCTKVHYDEIFWRK